MAAFEAAIAAGFGIECDVRISSDGQAFLFHDAALARMTGANGAIETLDSAHIDRLRLADGKPVPRLSALLALCPPDWPLLLEVKADGSRAEPFCEAVVRDLARQQRRATAIMSFHPGVVRWFARNRPQTVRGMIVTEQNKGKARARIESTLALWLAKPDFLACDVRDLPTPLSVRARSQGVPMLTWTVRSDAMCASAARHADQIIFERSHD